MTLYGQCEYCGKDYTSKQEDLVDQEYVRCKHCKKLSQNWKDYKGEGR